MIGLITASRNSIIVDVTEEYMGQVRGHADETLVYNIVTAVVYRMSKVW